MTSPENKCTAGCCFYDKKGNKIGMCGLNHCNHPHCKTVSPTPPSATKEGINYVQSKVDEPNSVSTQTTTAQAIEQDWQEKEREEALGVYNPTDREYIISRIAHHRKEAVEENKWNRDNVYAEGYNNGAREAVIEDRKGLRKSLKEMKRQTKYQPMRFDNDDYRNALDDVLALLEE